MPCLKPSLEQLVPGTGRRSGSKPPLLVSRALRWLRRDRKDARILKASKIPALHREAERDTTGSFSRQPLVHTWIGAWVQGTEKGSVAARQHLALFGEEV